MSDPRFARLTTDPRFRRPKQRQLKVELDDRFKQVLQGEEFGGSSAADKGKKKTDKYGRPLATTHHADKLKQFYRLRSPSPSSSRSGQPDAPAGEVGKDFVDYARGEGALESSGSEDEGEDGEDAVTSEEEGEIEIGGKARRRIPGRDVTDDEEEDTDDGGFKVDLSESEDDEANEPTATRSKGKDKQRPKSAFREEEYTSEPEDQPEEETIDPTTRIAIVNMDWDNLRSLDIHKVFSSILSSEYNPIEMPSQKDNKKRGESSTTATATTSQRRVAPPKPVGRLIKVEIFPSEFGKERMAREEVEGPAADLFVGGGNSRKGKGPNGRPRPVRRHQDGDEDDEDNLSVEGYAGYGKSRFQGSQDEDEDGEDDASDVESAPEEEEEDFEGSEDDDPLNLNMVGDDEPEEDESDRDEDVDMDKLRSYQLERLRYYYAVATFSTVDAAQYIFKECNGTEFERTANVFDMSYVPEDMDFDEEPKEVTTEEPKGYKGNDFVTDALRHSKVKLTWDQDDPNRMKVLRRTLTRAEMEEDDFTAYLASSSGEDDDEADELPADAKESDYAAAEARREKRKQAKEKTEKLRRLLLSGGDDGADVWGKHSTLPDMKDDATGPSGDMEITFKAGLTSATQALDEENLTTLERYQRRMKEKKERKKEKKELKAGSRAIENGEDAPVADDDEFFGGEDDEEATPAHHAPPAAPTRPIADKVKLPDTVPVADDAKHFSMQDIVKAEKSAGKRKRVRKSRKDGLERDVELGDEMFDINVKDDRFKAIFEEPAFAIDPSNPHFVKTKAMGKLLGEGSKRRQEVAEQRERRPVEAKQAAGSGAAEPAQKSVEELVASVKRKMGPDSGGNVEAEVAHKKRKRTRKHKSASAAVTE